MSNEYVSEFMEMQNRWNIIESEIIDIVNNYEDSIDFYTPNGVSVELSDNNIYVSLNTGAFPFAVIKELNEYFGRDCVRISVNVAHDIHLLYQF